MELESVQSWLESVDHIPLKQLSKESRDELAAYIELLFLRNGTVPTAADLRKEVPGCKISDESFAAYMADERLLRYLQDERGLPINPKSRISTKQLDWIKVITDPADLRPISRKLSELKLTKTEVNNWSSNPNYRAALSEFSDRQFSDSRNAVMRSLQIEAMSGNVQAMRMFLEMTGDYNPALKLGVVVEQRTVINNVIAILQELVHPDTLMQVVERLEQQTIPNHPATTRPALPPMSPTPKATAAVITERPPTPKNGRATVVDVESYTNEGW